MRNRRSEAKSKNKWQSNPATGGKLNRTEGLENSAVTVGVVGLRSIRLFSERVRCMKIDGSQYWYKTRLQLIDGGILSRDGLHNKLAKIEKDSSRVFGFTNTRRWYCRRACSEGVVTLCTFLTMLTFLLSGRVGIRVLLCWSPAQTTITTSCLD